MQSSRGFTLVELIVTIAVLGIIVSMAAPSFSTSFNKRQLDSASRFMSSGLNEARSRAAVMKATIVVCPNKKSDGTEITKKNCVESAILGADGDKYIAQNRVLLVNIPKKVSIKATSDLNIVFIPTGGAESRKTFIFCLGNESKTIEVSILGTLNQTRGTC